MDCSIEPMRIKDYDAVEKLWRATEGVGLGDGDDKESINNFLKRNSRLSFVARNASRDIVGAVLCGHDGRRAFLYHLAVEPSARRQGIGRSLVKACLAGLEKLSMSKFNLMVYANNEAGKRFWRMAGWDERPDLLLVQKKIRKN